MTIAISLKVNDGVVLAADSASTLVGGDPGGPSGVVNVYNHANKVFNLRKGLPIGAITWGSGSIGPASISTIAKDLRQRFSGRDPEHPDWHLDPDNYTIEHVAERLREFVFEELYEPMYQDWPDDGENDGKPDLGFIVAGYSSGAPMADEFQISVVNGECPAPVPLRQGEDSGLSWNGQPQAISRQLLGFDPTLPDIMHQQLGVPQDQLAPAMATIRAALQTPLVQPAMPFQDAIDLAEFLVDLTIKVSRFAPGAPTVGGEIEIAAISKHEGFKWVRRKHYFLRDYNEEDFRGRYES